LDICQESPIINSSELAERPRGTCQDCGAGGKGVKMKKDIASLYKYHLIAVPTICILCIIIYSNTLHSPFVFDDTDKITENSHIRLTSLDFQRLYDIGFSSISNRPVVHISFALNYCFGRYDPAGYHLVNITIHLISGLLVYFLSLAIFSRILLSPAQPLNRSTTGQIFLMSLFSALLFIAHPLQTQSVTYIVQRMNSMSVMFCLLALFLYDRGRIARISGSRWTLFFGSFMSWIMALGSKEIAVTLPFIVLLYEWYFFQDLDTAWLKRNIKYFLVPGVLLCLLAFIYLGINPIGKILAFYEHKDFTMWERVLTQFRVIIFYVSLLLYPHPLRLNLDHHITTSHSLVDPITTLLCLVTILGLMGLAFYIARRNRLISFGILWFFINLAVESSVIGLAMIFEHRLYFPMLGFALIVSYLVFHFLSNRRSWAIIISAVIVLSLGTATHLRNRVWQDGISLWSDAVSKNPQSYSGHNNLGVDLSKQDRTEEAIRHFSEALRIKPEYAIAHTGLGFALAKQGKTAEAISHFFEALRIDPLHVVAHTNLGNVFFAQGRLEKAISYYSRALQINPEYAEAHNNLGNALDKQGRATEAIKHFSEALRINPECSNTYYNMGIALGNLGRVDKAISYYRKALQIHPDFMEAHNNLGSIFLKQGRTAEAIRHFSEALRINPNFASAHNNLKKALTLQAQTKKNSGNW